MDDEDAVSSREINRRQKKKTGSNGISQIKEDAKLIALKMKSLLFTLLPTSTRQPLRLPKPHAKPWQKSSESTGKLGSTIWPKSSTRDYTYFGVSFVDTLNPVWFQLKNPSFQGQVAFLSHPRGTFDNPIPMVLRLLILIQVPSCFRGQGHRPHSSCRSL